MQRIKLAELNKDKHNVQELSNPYKFQAIYLAFNSDYKWMILIIMLSAYRNSVSSKILPPEYGLLTGQLALSRCAK